MSAVPETSAAWQQDNNAQQIVASIQEQEKLLQLKAFNNDIALQIGSAIHKKLQEQYTSSSALVSIRLWSGLTPYQLAYGPSVTQNNEDWITRKTNTTRSFAKSSFLVGRELVTKGRDINSLGPGFAAHGGAVPISIENVGVIGAVIVSGLAQWQDHALAVEAVAAVKAKLSI